MTASFAPLAPIFLLSAFFLGLAVGSFLNVVILRGARGEGLGGRSRCDTCARILTLRELIPVVSFFWQKARCRSCGAALSRQYPVVEGITAFAFLAIAGWMIAGISSDGAAQGSLGPSAFLLFPAVAAIIVLVVSDLRFQILPDGAVAILFLCGLLVSWQRAGLAPDLAAACAIAFFFALLWFVSRGRWMGLGDAKLIFAASLITGFPVSLAAFLFAVWLGGAWGMALLALGAKGLKSRIPFGPFIIAGMILALFFGDLFLTVTGLNLFF